MLDWLPWPDAAAMAAGTGAATAATRHRLRPLRPWAGEVTLLLVLYAMWQYAGAWSIGRASAAAGRGLAIWRAERWLHLPSERAVQAAFLGHRTLLHLANEWYAEVHVPALGVLLVWCFWRHRDRYPALRAVVVGVTAASLLIALLPVAPPRLLPSLGVVDTAAVIGPSTYAGGAPGIDQLSAMPSLHVGWALIVGGGVVWASQSRWRWVALAYPVLTAWVVVVTGNHFEADGIAAAALCALATAGTYAWSRAASSSRRSPSSSRWATAAANPAAASTGASAASWPAPTSTSSTPPARSSRPATVTAAPSSVRPPGPPSSARRGSKARTSRGSRRSDSVGT
ncbi:MAG TPA: phosphatase PAP2 family protein [Acidimicrobiales bacterium]|nr:phosphatase PAP2 family protein [Acidimicrobiales bacterium]